MLELASERSRKHNHLAAMMDGILVINSERLVVLRNNAAARIMPDCARGKTRRFPGPGREPRTSGRSWTFVLSAPAAS